MNIQPLGLEPVSATVNASASRTTTPFSPQGTPTPVTEAEVNAGKSPTATEEKNKQELRKQAEEAVKKITDFVGVAASDLQFSIDNETEMPVVKVVDRATKEVIRQIPSQEAIDISKALDKLNGLLIKQQV